MLSLLLGCFSTVSSTVAQDLHAPFDTLDVRLGWTRDVSSGPLGRYWSPGASFTLGASTPFYAGRVSAGLRVESFDNRDASVPPFVSGYLSLGWGFEWTMQHGSRHELGFHFGDFFMRFDTDSVAGTRNESELAGGAYYQIRMRISDRAGVFVRGSYTGVLTEHRLNLFHVSAGIALRSATPVWLRTLLQ